MRVTALFYVRYMDDILILTKTCWKCRRAIKQLNQAFIQLRLEKHPDKTFIGKVEKGFDFLGYHFSPEGLSVADATVRRFIEKATRLYEQEKGKPEGFPLLGLYVRRWTTWIVAGLEQKPNAGAVRPLAVSGVGGICRCRPNPSGYQQSSPLKPRGL